MSALPSLALLSYKNRVHQTQALVKNGNREVLTTATKPGQSAPVTLLSHIPGPSQDKERKNKDDVQITMLLTAVQSRGEKHLL